jgi:hypothetical protein
MTIIPSGLTIYARWPRWAARLVLALGVALIVIAAIPREQPHLDHLGPPGYDDRYFQRTVADRVAKGGNYYAVAAAEQRAHGYPTAPPMAFREPALTWGLALLKTQFWRRTALLLLLAAATVAMREALDRTSIPKMWRFPATLCQISGFAIAWHSLQVYQHEVWAALLMALSLALYRPQRYWPAICIAVLACLVRELAFAFMLAMAAFAIYEKRRGEALAWGAGMVAFVAVFEVHFVIASKLYHRGDIISSGWLYLGGWNFVIEASRKNEVLFYAPAWVVAAAVVLSVLGLAGWRDPLVSRTALIVGGYVIAFLFVGRPDNQYWGELYSPLLPLGWALAPAALYDLVSRATRRSSA